MKLRSLLFRFRALVFPLVYVLGFFAPWESWLRGSRTTLWLALATLLARTGWVGLEPATIVVTVAALCFIALGAFFRVWGTAYLGSAIMMNPGMQGGQVTASGPYRYTRNPLYLGSELLAIGVSILMPLTGAIVFLSLHPVLLLGLISGEEQFLAQRQGSLYREYCRLVPRLLPRLLPTLRAAPFEVALSMEPGHPPRPRWLQAFSAEVMAVGFALCFTAFAWRYNAEILIRCLIICYGASLVARAVAPRSVQA